MEHHRPDVVLSFLPPANTPSLIAGRMTGTPVIPTNHNVPAEDYASKKRWDQNPLDKALRLRALRTAARVHVLFPVFADWFPPDIRGRVVAIPNFIAAGFSPPPPGQPRRKVILAAGRLAEVKQHALLIDAWAQLAVRHPDWAVHIHGDGPLRDKLQQQIDQLGLGARVRLLGNTDDMAAAYRNAELLCHPARFEGFGLAVAEALACGTPVVAFAECAGVNQIVRDGDNGLLVPAAGGAAALATGLDRLITDDALRAGLRARAATSVSEFSRDAVRTRWFSLVNDIVAARARRAG
jgi:glycosyltransferase involved in cell wall biosynthesis